VASRPDAPNAAQRIVRPLPLPAGPRVLQALPALAAALDGRGPALMPLPEGTPAPAELGPGAPLAAGEDDPADPTALVVSTSGSTGAAKGALLSAGGLRASAAATDDRLGGPGRWLLALPPWHVAGLQVLLRSLRGEPPIVLPAGPFGPEVFTASAQAMPAGRRYVSLVPTQLHRILQDPVATDALAAFDAVLVGGAATAPALLATARSAGIAVVTTYGMTETCGGCVYDGRPLSGVSVDLEVDGAPGDPGRIVLSGPVVARGYRGRPGDAAFAVPGSFVTGDLGAWSDGRLQILGRADDVIVTGGLKVAPQQVEAAIAALPGVSAAVVVGVPDEQWGEVVTAVVVPADSGFDPDAIRRLSALAPHQRPRRVEVVRAVPQRGPGKPDRRAIRDGLIHDGQPSPDDHPRSGGAQAGP
jgi:o-succinylbenzoate---CoA ligase